MRDKFCKKPATLVERPGGVDRPTVLYRFQRLHSGDLRINDRQPFLPLGQFGFSVMLIHFREHQPQPHSTYIDLPVLQFLAQAKTERGHIRL